MFIVTFGTKKLQTGPPRYKVTAPVYRVLYLVYVGARLSSLGSNLDLMVHKILVSLNIKLNIP